MHPGNNVIIYPPMWLQWITVPLLGFLTGLLMRSLGKKMHIGLRVVIALILGSAATAIATQIPYFIPTFLGPKWLRTIMLLHAFAPGAAAALAGEIFGDWYNMRGRTAIWIVVALAMSYLAGALVFSIGAAVPIYKIYAHYWLTDKLPLFVLLLIAGRFERAPRKEQDSSVSA